MKQDRASCESGLNSKVNQRIIPPSLSILRLFWYLSNKDYKHTCLTAAGSVFTLILCMSVLNNSLIILTVTRVASYEKYKIIKIR